jgi:hypothetical protein
MGVIEQNTLFFSQKYSQKIKKNGENSFHEIKIRK